MCCARKNAKSAICAILALGFLVAYPAMKNSGVLWLGDVPAHWEVRRLKQVCRLAYGDALATDVRQDGPIPVFGSNGHVGFHNSANTKSPCIVIGRKGSFGKVNYSRDPVVRDRHNVFRLQPLLICPYPLALFPSWLAAAR